MQNQISVIAELTRIGIVPQYKGAEVVILCPFHDDTTPSCQINPVDAKFHCFACGKAGGFVELLAKIVNRPEKDVWAELGQRYGNIGGDRTISANVVEQCHNALIGGNSGALLQELYNRGVTDEIIRKRRYGLDVKTGRITIPIYNASHHCVNIKQYLPGAPSADKMRNTKGHGQPRLYPIEQLKYDKILLCGGELKAAVAAEQLNVHGIGAICNTSGEQNWSAEHSAAFSGKHVWICLDVDETGKAGALLRCRALARFVEWLGQPINLPLDISQHPKGDINDFIAAGGQLLPLLEACERYVPEPLGATFDVAELPESVLLGQAMTAAYTGKRVAIKAVLAAIDTQGYPIPGRVDVHCNKEQDYCGACPVFHRTDAEGNEFDIGREHPAILEMVGNDKGGQPEAIKSALGIPAQCTVCAFEALEYLHAEETRVSPQLEISSRATERVMQPAIILTDALEPNETYILTGRMHPNPRTQAATLLISEVAPAQDALSTYAPSDDELERLRLFQPGDWSTEGIGEKLNQLYSDLSTNVTQIFQRHRMHLIYDLAYHSPLMFSFDGGHVNGWLQVLVIGDSGQGKSECINQLIEHYGLGDKADCKNASGPGLLGGLQQMGTKWLVSWGVIPTNDKRLVALEELQGLTPEIISRLTNMRSSGIAELDKIEKKRTHARTRIIAISNPRSFGGENIRLSSYSFGVEAIRELIGSLEDIRRFDAIFMAADGDVDPTIINKRRDDRPHVEHVHTGELCRALILWAWTRKADEVFFTDEATTAVMRAAIDLCEMFTDAVPIVDRGSMRLKLARLAAALAARTFSTADLRTLCVLPTHVEFVKQTLIAEYSRKVFGYVDYTAHIRAALTIREPELLINAIAGIECKYDLVNGLLVTDQIDLATLQAFASCDRTDAERLASLFVRKGGLKRDGKYYYKTPPFIELLKRIEVDGSLDAIDKTRPNFIRPENEQF